MPKTGFKSITVSKTVYDRFQEAYQSNKERLSRKGINSLAGYITYLLEDAMQEDLDFARYAPMLERVDVTDESIVIRDHIKKRIVEVAIQNETLYCMLCEEHECMHVGFVFAMPDVYKALQAKGIRRR